MGKYEYSGNISANVHFDYFPFDVKDKSKTSYEIAYEINPDLFAFFSPPFPQTSRMWDYSIEFRSRLCWISPRRD